MYKFRDEILLASPLLLGYKLSSKKRVVAKFKCEICNKLVSFRNSKTHLDSHNISVKDYIMRINEISIESIPKCVVCKTSYCRISSIGRNANEISILNPKILAYCDSIECGSSYRSYLTNRTLGIDGQNLKSIKIVSTKRSDIDEYGRDQFSRSREKAITTMKSIIDNEGNSDWNKSRSLAVLNGHETLRNKIDPITGRSELSLKNQRIYEKSVESGNSLKPYSSKHGKFFGIRYDSSFEEYFLMSLTPGELKVVKRSHKINYSNGRSYYPDYLIGDVYYEIKSDYYLISEWNENFEKFSKMLELGKKFIVIINRNKYHPIVGINDIYNLKLSYDKSSTTSA